MVQAKAPVVTMSDGDTTLIISLSQYHYLTAEQITRLYFAPGSLIWVRSKRLKSLVDRGYIQLVRDETGKPVLPYVYTLDGLGVRYLKKLGIETRRYFRPYQQIDKSIFFLKHTLAVNDVLIAAFLLARDVPEITLVDVQHELVLKTEPCKVTYLKTTNGQVREVSKAFVPDGWLAIAVDTPPGRKPRRFGIWLEVDRGTVERKQFKEKVRAILEYIKSGEYRKRFNNKTILVAFATTAGQGRVEKMRLWIRDEVSRTQEKKWLSDLFLTTAIPQNIEPGAFFLEPVWYTPFDDKMVIPIVSLG